MACNSIFWLAKMASRAKCSLCMYIYIYFILAKYGDRMLRPCGRQRHRYITSADMDFGSGGNGDGDGDGDAVKCCRCRCRRHFGQFLHLRKRSSDRLRACGDLTVFMQPTTITTTTTAAAAAYSCRLPLLASLWSRQRQIAGPTNYAKGSDGSGLHLATIRKQSVSAV